MSGSLGKRYEKDRWTGRHVSRRCDRGSSVIARSTTPSGDPGLRYSQHGSPSEVKAKRTVVDVRKVAQQSESGKDSQDLVPPSNVGPLVRLHVH